jgi:hypothetical protein
MSAIGVLVVGPSGAGKSTSMMNLDPNSTYIINVQGKALPFPKGRDYKRVPKGGRPDSGNMYSTDDVPTILQVLQYVSDKMPDMKTVVIDDWQYCAANEFMRKAEVKGFEKFTQIGKHIWELANAPTNLRDDLTVIYLTHEEELTDSTGARKKKAKTIGKLVDDKITLEGMFTIVLYADVETKEEGGSKKLWNHFVTQNVGDTTAKSPMGMFSELKIDNDLKTVVDTINGYYGRGSQN